MKCITLKANSHMDYTTVSNAFIDNYMPQANGEFVKVYLYLLRCMSDPDIDLSISMIADKFDHTEKDVIRALRYFAGKGLISIEYGPDDELSAITFLPINSEFTVVTEDNSNNKTDSSKRVVMQPSAVSPAASDIPQKPSYSAAMLREFTENEEISQLLYMTEKYMGKTLSFPETGTIIYMYDSLKFSTDLIEYLIEYCISRGHKSMRYIEKVALAWAENGIDTVDAAREYSESYSCNMFSVMKAFGLSGRGPAEVEKNYINRWYNEYGFETDIIVEACNRTIQTIHKPNFEYADTILKSWKLNNVIHMKDIEALDLQHNSKKQQQSEKTAAVNRFNNYTQRTYDFEQLEKRLLTQ